MEFLQEKMGQKESEILILKNEKDRMLEEKMML